MKQILFFILSLCVLTAGYSQVGINILIPDSSAALQVESNKKGLGLPRLNSAQMNAITSPLKGLTIFNTSDSLVEYWNGECWLKAWEKNCYYCDFQMTINHPADTLDRVNADSVFATITVSHTHGSGPVSVTYTTLLPTGVQLHTQGPTIIDTSGSFNVIVSADVFAASGNVPILLTATCGDQVHFVAYNVYIKPCLEVDIVNDNNNYDVQGSNTSLLPAGSKVCLLVNVANGVTLHSADATLPALTIGNLDPLSIVGILNNGAILGRGGDGAGFQTATSGGTPGHKGGNALNLTTRTQVRNTGQIFAGGGGGGDIGLSYPLTIPIIGTISLGFGAGGGGGSENGVGGTTPGSVNIGLYSSGSSATASSASVPGAGGSVTLPLSYSISVVTLHITPSFFGGNGGAFAQSGTQATGNITIGVTIPIIGTISYPINVPIGGIGGTPGLAIERNGNTLQGIADGYYNSLQLKGVVAP